MLTFFNITEYPHGVTRHPPKGSPAAVSSMELKIFQLQKLIEKKPPEALTMSLQNKEPTVFDVKKANYVKFTMQTDHKIILRSNLKATNTFN